MTNENDQALFYNFTDKPFTGYWDGKAKTFKAGAKQYMEAWRARHYAKHLVNQVLLEQGKENATSPKFPDQVPAFKELFDKACIIEEEQDENQDAADLIDKQHQPLKKEGKTSNSVDNKKSKDSAPEEEEEFEGLEEKPKK